MRDAARVLSSAGAVALLGVACAGGGGVSDGDGGGRVPDTSGFPSQGQLERLGEAPVSASSLDLGVRTVDSWELAGPFPEQAAVQPHREPGSPWSELLQREAGRRAGLVVPTEAMHCVARELGRFHLAHGAQPSLGLRRFMLARCNAAVGGVGFRHVAGASRDEEPEAELFARWKGSTEQAIREVLRGGPQTAGIWFGREDGRAVAMVAFGRRDLHLEAFRSTDTGSGAVELRGEALFQVEEIGGLVNHGRFEAVPCEPVGELPLPAFHLRCPVDPEDESALLTLTVRPPGRLLGTAALHSVVWPRGRESARYVRPVYGEPWPMLDDVDFGDHFVALLNRTRREAGLDALELDRAQSETARELAPHFFSAFTTQGEETTADLIVLGLVAGWGIDGIVQTGHFAANWVVGSNDLSELLASALEYPVSREALMADEVERIAVGPLLLEEDGETSMAAVFGTYALFSEQTHDAMARRVYEKLDAERERRGRAPSQRLVEVAWRCQEAASSVHAGSEPTDALQSLLEESVVTLGRPVQGWIAEVSEIDQLELPEEYLRRQSVAVAVSVTHRRPKGQAWGRYVVMLVVADPPARGV